ncbi:MAG: hypothetical protein IIV84_02400 [Selenomonadales bacterium]|nr:hypothetical protein [Selenomonadales bacterium]
MKTGQEYGTEQMCVCRVRPMRISADGGAVVVVIYRATGRHNKRAAPAEYIESGTALERDMRYLVVCHYTKMPITALRPTNTPTPMTINTSACISLTSFG